MNSPRLWRSRKGSAHAAPLAPTFLPRLRLGVATGAAVLALISAGAYHKLDQAFEHSAQLTRNIERRTQANLQLQRMVQGATLPVHHYHMDGDPETRHHFLRLAGQIDQGFAQSLAGRDADGRSALAAVQADWQAARRDALDVLSLRDPNRAGLKRIHMRIHQLDTNVRAVSQQLEALQQQDQALVQRQLAQAAVWNHRLTVVVIGAFFLTVLSIMLGAASVIRSQGLLRELSIRDALTGLYNRREFQVRLQRHLANSRRLGQPCSVLLLDIDHFKGVNDTHGHDVGDQVLREVSQLVTRTVRGVDVVARFGGEELVVILPEADEAVAMTTASRIRETVASHAGFVTPDGAPLSITVSIGVSTFPLDATAEAALLRAADQGMYVAKRAGRNQVGRAASADPA